MSRAEWVEGVLMLLCIPLLWPIVRSMRTGAAYPPYYGIVLVVGAAALVTITVRRVLRLRKAFREQRGGQSRFPF